MSIAKYMVQICGMKKWINRISKNKYAIALVLFLGWICFFNDIDLFYIIESRIELMKLRKEVKEMRKQNELATAALRDLESNTASLEKFARETYYMKKPNEVVYVFKERTED